MAGRFAADHFQHDVWMEMRPARRPKPVAMRSIEGWTDIAQELQVTISLVHQGGSEADNEDPPA